MAFTRKRPVRPAEADRATLARLAGFVREFSTSSVALTRRRVNASDRQTPLLGRLVGRKSRIEGIGFVAEIAEILELEPQHDRLVLGDVARRIGDEVSV